MNGIITEEWAPCDKLLGIANINNYGIIVLNTPITVHCKPSFLVDLWNRGTAYQKFLTDFINNQLK